MAHHKTKMNLVSLGVLASTSVAISILFGPALVGEAKSPPDFEKLLQKGNYELQIGNTEKAIGLFKEKTKKYPQSGACHTALGRAFKRLGKTSEAKAEFKAATEAEPTYAPGFYELGVVLEGDQEFQAAADAFEKFVALSPDAGQRQAVTDRIKFCRSK